MRNPYAAPEPRDAAWWLLLLLVAALTLVLVVSPGKDRAPGTHLGYAPGQLGNRSDALPPARHKLSPDTTQFQLAGHKGP